MNIFVLDLDPVKAAQYHCDKHVSKMIIESAQLLCTAHHMAGSNLDIPYKSTHKNHPSAIWTRASIDNYRWLCQLGLALCKEYKNRYGQHKTHATQRVIEWAIANEPNLPNVGLTPFALCMPEEFKRADAVEAYRALYRGPKSVFAEWRNGKPEWYNG